MTRMATTVAAAVMAVLGVAPVLAHGPHARGEVTGTVTGTGPAMMHGHRWALFAQLDLTVEQRDGIRDLFAEHRLATQPQREERRAAHRALHDAIHAETYDEAAVRAASAQVAKEVWPERPDRVGRREQPYVPGVRFA